MKRKGKSNHDVTDYATILKVIVDSVITMIQDH